MYSEGLSGSCVITTSFFFTKQCWYAAIGCGVFVTSYSGYSMKLTLADISYRDESGESSRSEGQITSLTPQPNKPQNLGQRSVYYVSEYGTSCRYDMSQPSARKVYRQAQERMAFTHGDIC